MIDSDNNKNYNSLNNYYKSDKRLSSNFGNIFHNIMTNKEEDGDDNDNLAKKKWQENVDKIYNDFKKHIKDNKNIDIVDEKTGGGRIFSGDDAKKNEILSGVNIS